MDVVVRVFPVYINALQAVAVAVTILKLLLTSVGLPQQLLGCLLCLVRVRLKKEERLLCGFSELLVLVMGFFLRISLGTPLVWREMLQRL